jgi:hypothetical protein
MHGNRKFGYEIPKIAFIMCQLNALRVHKNAQRVGQLVLNQLKI